MNTRSRRLPWLSLTAVLLSAHTGLAAPLEVGVAAVKITPPIGAPMAGYYFARASEGVHDDLHAKAIVIEQDGTKAALVALDLIHTTRNLVEEARRLIEHRAGIAGDHVMISATHAHTGPVLADRSGRTASLGGASELAIAYMRTLPERIADSVAEANGNLEAATISTSIGREEALAFNRRFHMVDGTVGWNPGRLNPKILRPAGPIDPAVPVVYFASEKARPLAVYVNFAMHLDTVGGLEISADYPFTLANILQKVKGDDLLTVFTIGTAGDINHVNVGWKDQPHGHREAARIGAILAGDVIQTLPRLAPVQSRPLQVLHEMVRLPLPEISATEVAQAVDVTRRISEAGSSRPTFLEQVKAFKVLDVRDRNGARQEVEVQVVSLGRDLAWVSLPGEIFVELGLAIKQASPFPATILAELANGSIGYIPTRQAYTQGNYEVVSARCAAGSGELLVEAASRLLRDAYRKAATDAAP